MYQYSSTIFNQLLNFLPKNKFDQYVGQHNADRYIKKLTAWNQLILMIYAQVTGKESLREIEAGFNTHPGCWHHLGVNTAAKSSIADANRRRSYQVFEKLFYALLAQCQDVLPEKEFTFNNPLYSFDSTTIQLCLAMFDWAKYRTQKGALKMHTLLNNRTMIPELIDMSDGKTSDISMAKRMELEKLKPGSIIVFDRAYIDYAWWWKLNKNGIFFVSRTKSSSHIFVVGQHTINLEPGIISDELVIFGSYGADEKYPEKLRLVKYYNKTKQETYSYLTNNMELSASQIAFIYKQRWQVELFFKWIKQNLKIKTFLGTSENAVLTQIWIAMIYYLLLSYIKFQTKFKKTLQIFTVLVRETLLLRRNLIDLLSLDEKTVIRIKIHEEVMQMSFW